MTKFLFTLNAKFSANVWRDDTSESRQYISMGIFTPGAIIRVRKNNDLFSFCVSIFPPCRSAMKWAIQLDLSLDHVPGAAAVAQKAEPGGAVSKTSVNKHRR